jgi:hypothetical protein
MHLIHEATVKHPDGVIDISLFVVKEPDNIKRYTYHLKSEYISRRFEMYYKKGRGLHGTALALLNKHKIKEEEKS